MIGLARPKTNKKTALRGRECKSLNFARSGKTRAYKLLIKGQRYAPEMLMRCYPIRYPVDLPTMFCERRAIEIIGFYGGPPGLEPGTTRF
jgi:hypothetical protein